MATEFQRNSGVPQAESFLLTPPSVSLPKGGGAIRGIGEKFGANPVTGTGSMSVPIVTSPGRSGFGPQLALAYDSGSGNGTFGFGWSLALPSITRKTEQGLPRYLDDQESDVFLLSGVEDLVPDERPDVDIDGYRVRRYRPRLEGLFARIERWTRLVPDGHTHWRSISKDNQVTQYGLDESSRIADPLDPGRVFSWLISQTRDDKGNAVVYRYRADDGTGVDPAQIQEAHRGSPDDDRRRTNRYLKRILYGNRKPFLDTATGRRPRFLTPAQESAADWMFELVLDYGDHDSDAPGPRDDEIELLPGVRQYPWGLRPDPHSSYRSGFEVRTTRRCRRALMFHHFADDPEVGRDCLVRSSDFSFSDDEAVTGHSPIYSFLTSVSQCGYRRDAGGYRRRSMPPLEFSYTQAEVQATVEQVDVRRSEDLPIGLDGISYQWTDLHAEGTPGILAVHADAWFYKRNLSPAPGLLPDGRQLATARFGPSELVARTPSASPGQGAQIMDLAGDGLADVVMLAGSSPGFFEHDDAEGWKPFRPFTSLPNIDLSDPNLRFVDLDADGHADILITEEDAVVWYPSLAEEGFGSRSRIPLACDENSDPRVVFADGTESVQLSDLSGDGLPDLVRIRNGDISYWPNLGYGRFGAKVAMANAPRFDHPDRFDPGRLRVADIDGSGTADLIYLHPDGVDLYFNQSGNSWSAAQHLTVFPRTDDLSTVLPVDLLGNGTACLVWSSPAPSDAGRAMCYVDLMTHKPHLLATVINNLGAETRFEYAPSTKFYLQDKRDGRPWVTRLPMPVHVVERVITIDHVSRNRFVSRYAYHHGYFDGDEREFRGFGMVEQWDSEELGALSASGNPAADNSGSGNPAADNEAADNEAADNEAADNEAADNEEPGSQVAPVHTKTWYHTGLWRDRAHVSDYFAGQLNSGGLGEYFREPGLTDEEARALLLPDTILPAGLTVDEEREACRALKGSMLRQEVYAVDAGPGADRDQVRRSGFPYSVVEQSFTVRALQPRNNRRHSVFHTQLREAIFYHYERNPADPRVQHAITLEVDSWGNVCKKAMVGYGRREQIRSPAPDAQVQLEPNPGLAALDPGDRMRQTTSLLTYTENRFSKSVESTDSYRLPVPYEEVTFELTGYQPTGSAGRFGASDLIEPDPDTDGELRHRFAVEVPYEESPSPGRCRRAVEWLRSLYRSDDLSRLLPLTQLESLGLTGESYRLAFTPGLLNAVFQRPRLGDPAESLLPNPAAELGGRAGDRGGYLPSQDLKADGRFPDTDADDQWWAPTGRAFLSGDPLHDAAAERSEAQQHFFLTRRTRDPFGQDTFADFDDDDLLVTQIRDPLGNRVTVEANDYRVLQPRTISDPNGNRTEVAVDTLGFVVGTAVMGKPEPARAEGDTLSGFVAELTPSQVDGFLDALDPHTTAANLLQGATTRLVYDLDQFRRTRSANPEDPHTWQPAVVATLARETHVHATLPPQGLRIQLSFSYSDGLGREIQKKVAAEPAKIGGLPGPPRWVGTGWTIYNNKGNPVRQYEPFFSSRLQPDGTKAGDHRFEFGVTVGVSPVLFYDPVERVIATLLPQHTYEKVVFDAWQTTTYDVNDTSAPLNAQTGDPRTDPDIGGAVARYFATLPAGSAGPAGPTWQTWRAQRINGQLGPDEQAATVSASVHADTPTTAHLDTLGRPFLTVARNRIVSAGHDFDGTEDSVRSWTDLDIEGNPRVVRDERRLPVDHIPTGAAEQRTVMRSDFNLLGESIRQISMEAGTRWMLNDAVGRPIRAWDSRGHTVTSGYDAARRPVTQTVRGSIDGASDPRTLNRDVLVDLIQYGEPPIGASRQEQDLVLRLNLRGRTLRHFDSAGVAVNARIDPNGHPVEAYDFKGNPMCAGRRLATDYTAIPDWSLVPLLDAETYSSTTRYDALNRVAQSVAPRSHLPRASFMVTQPVYNQGNLLERVDVWLDRDTEPDGMLDPAVDPPSPVGVADVDYDAKGQRLRIDYKNGAISRYGYDPETFRLTDLYTRRGPAFTADCDNPDPQPPPTIAAPEKPPPNGMCGLQNLHYTYDPAGNIINIRDGALPTVFFRNRRVEPSNDYTYDALYRLIQASGREQLGLQANGVRNAPTASGANNVFHIGHDHPGDGNALGSYVERYVYDGVGNILQMQHRGSDPAHAGWTRIYDYLEPSQLDDGAAGAPARFSNRLSRTSLNPNGANPPTVEPYQHDTHGNMVRMPHLGNGDPAPNLLWDYRDQLRLTELGGGGTAYYVYDAFGERIRKVWEKAPGLVEERIYLGGSEIFRRHNGPVAAASPTLERETMHVMDDRRRIALVEIRTLDTAGTDQSPARLIRYQLGNHLGSSSIELDDGARIISYEEYSPYGNSTYQAVRSRTEAPKRYRFTGQERDEESGLSYHGARYYAPWLGRWAAPDPSGLADGINRYAYGQCRPITVVDPTGLAGEPSELIESIKLKTRANKNGYTNEGKIQIFVKKEAHSWGLNPKDYEAGHASDTPQWKTKVGEPQWIGPQSKVLNNQQSTLEAAESKAAKANGAFSRVNRTQVGAPNRVRYPEPLPPDVKKFVKTYDPAAAEEIKKAYLSRNAKTAKQASSAENTPMEFEPPGKTQDYGETVQMSFENATEGGTNQAGSLKAVAVGINAGLTGTGGPTTTRTDPTRPGSPAGTDRLQLRQFGAPPPRPAENSSIWNLWGLLSPSPPEPKPPPLPMTDLEARKRMAADPRSTY